MSVYLFPGQGSQYKGMGARLFTSFPEITAIADDLLGYSIKTLCIDDPDQLLNQTQYTQPALYTVNALMYLEKIKHINCLPTFVAGHSLGEYNALLAAGVFDFSTGLQLVKKRGELMSQAIGGSMAAVVGLTKKEILSVLDHLELKSVVIANDNSYTQFVISGIKNEVEQAQIAYKQAGAILVLPLKTSGAFHSSAMQSAQLEFECFLKKFQFSYPSISTIANYTAEPYLNDNIAHNLAQQMTHPVRWTEIINTLLAQGETEFTEIGPGKVLMGLLQQIQNAKTK